MLVCVSRFDGRDPASGDVAKFHCTKEGAVTYCLPFVIPFVFVNRYRVFACVLCSQLLRPMRCATGGSLLASELALKHVQC
jgi:hypothetical protein